jgi:succinylglutamate desuccinylase
MLALCGVNNKKAFGTPATLENNNTRLRWDSTGLRSLTPDTNASGVLIIQGEISKGGLLNKAGSM